MKKKEKKQMILMIIATLTQIKSSSRAYCVQQFTSKHISSRVPWQFQQIHTCTGTWESFLIFAGISDAKSRVEMAEPEQRSTRS